MRQRLGEAFDAKRAIAVWAAAQVRTGETVLLDTGMTTDALVRELRHAGPLFVVTTGMTALSELATAERIDLQYLGGTLRPLSEGSGHWPRRRSSDGHSTGSSWVRTV